MRSHRIIVFTATATVCLLLREMAVLQTILNFLTAPQTLEPEFVVPAPATTYSVHPLKSNQLDELLRLNIRCFRNGENYTKHTFAYLLDDARTLAYKADAASGEMIGFAFLMLNENGAAHLTTLGVAPEHRRRGVADNLLQHLERSLRAKGIDTVHLEVRVTNAAAQKLYKRAGYTVVQRIASYYNNGEDCLLMMKSVADGS